MLLIQRLLAKYRSRKIVQRSSCDCPVRRVVRPRANLIMVATLTLAIGSSAVAQDPFGQTNPFGSADPFGGAAAAATAPAGPTNQGTEALDPLLYAIMKQDLSQPAQRVLAAETLFLLKRPAQANQILSELKQPLSGREAYDFVYAVTSSRIFWVQSQIELQPTAGVWLSSTLANAMQYANSEESTTLAISQLLNGTVAEQTAATEKLLAMGLSAAMPLLQGMQGIIQSGDLQSAQLRRLVQIIQTGPDGWDVTLRSLVGSESALESAAILGLAARSRSVLNQAAVLEWSARQPGSLPEPALAPVIAHWRTVFQAKHGFDPEQREFTSRWLEQACQAELARWNTLQSPRTQLQVMPPTGWLWDASVQSLTPQLVEPLEQVGRNQALLATAWLRVDAENDAALRNYVAAQFKRAKLLNGVDQPLPKAAVDVAAQYLTPVQMNEMLLAALESGQWLVAQSLLESLQTVGSSELLLPTSGNLSPVVVALKATDQRVRSAAVQTILAWKPEQSFSGASYFNQGVRELLSNPIGTYAMVASMNPYHSAYLESLVRTSGWNASAASSAGQLITDLDLYPASFLIITDSLGDVPYLTVVDQVRSTTKGKTMPILLLVRSENMPKARTMFQVERNDYYTVVAEFSENGRDLLPWIEKMSSLKEVTGQLPSLVALEQAQQGLKSMSAWLGIDRSRRLLDFPSFAPTARGLMGHSAETDRLIAEILSHFGDPDTQVYLASVASDASATAESRSAAARAFRLSVQRFGTLLTSKQIESQYLRQNQSASEGPFTQAILNSLLDTLEARSKRVPFVDLPPVPEM
ncbi:MAG: hypothetical protein Q8M16_07760 [Pirellulaceae bacterium]|nr:hypothetical protein [Pirellulaceae bacterium]